MPQIYFPIISKPNTADTTIPTPEPTPVPTEPPAPTPTPGSTKIAIDPLTRIEGHLRIEVQIEDGIVTDAWSSSTMFRGLEMILQGRDPRDAWLITQRLCGVCTTVHAIASVRAVENALGVQVPDNARLIRNLLEGAQFIHDHVIHFYHLHALDWVDLVSALDADTSATAALASSLSSWRNSSVSHFAGVKDRLQTFVESGQLGLYANAYWGHESYHLPPEVNLLAVSHYFDALEWQREYIQMHALLGGKNPHPQAYLVGGMAMCVDPDSDVAINADKVARLRAWSQSALEFVREVYMPDLIAIAGFYPEWTQLGRGPRNFMAFGDFPENTSGDVSALWIPRGIVWNGNLQAAPEVLDHQNIEEYIQHSWYSYNAGDAQGIHPWQGETRPNFTGPEPPYEFLNTDDKYSWLKAPRYKGAVMEVGPLARMVVAYAAGHQRVREEVNRVLTALNVGPDALFSTLGRVAARAIETQLLAEKMLGWIDEVETNMLSGNLATHNGERWEPDSWPKDVTGWGTTEAPRGALGHWLRIRDKKIANYQMVVPSTWNGSPRDPEGQPGAWEQALIGTPIANPEQPVEILRTIHSFDPCMACAVHIVDTKQQALFTVETQH